MTNKKNDIATLISISIVISALAFVIVSDRVSTKLTQENLGLTDQAAAELQLENAELREELSLIKERTFQVWFITDDGAKKYVGHTRFMTDLIPYDSKGNIVTEAMFTGDLGDHIGWCDNRTDLYIYEADVR